MSQQILIQKPLNGVFFLSFGLFFAAFLLMSLLCRKKSDRFKRRLLSGLMLATLVIFVGYKIALFLDADYNAIRLEENLGNFNWFGELPLQLCNINMLLIPIALRIKKRPLFGFCFFTGPLGALMALLMPCAGFDCYSILLPRMLGYYITHYMVFFGSLSLCTLGLYRPKYKDILPTVIMAIALSMGVFLINLLLRFTGLNPFANYMYSVKTEGNVILELFHSWLPFPYAYLLPCALILIPYMFLVTTPFTIIAKKKNKAVSTV